MQVSLTPGASLLASVSHNPAPRCFLFLLPAQSWTFLLTGGQSRECSIAEKNRLHRDQLIFVEEEREDGIASFPTSDSLVDLSFQTLVGEVAGGG
jgi:hypothetical protein